MNSGLLEELELRSSWHVISVNRDSPLFHIPDVWNQFVQILMPEPGWKSPVLLDYFYLLWLLETFIEVAIPRDFQVLGDHLIDWLFTHISISL